MAFDFVCPFCHSKTRVNDNFAGQTGPCADCGHIVTIPFQPGTRKPSSSMANASNKSNEPGSDSSTLSDIKQNFDATQRRSVKVAAKRYFVQIAVVVCTLLVISVGGAFILLPTARNAIQARQKSVAMNNIRQISKALNAYRRLHGSYPTPTVRDAIGKPLYSWRVLILPQLGYQALYNRFQLDQSFDSPTNISLINEMPVEYASPTNTNSANLKESNYALVVGPGTLFPYDAPAVDPVTMSDSPAETILVVETRESGASWTQSADIDATAGVRLGSRAMQDIGGNSQEYAVVATVNETTYPLSPTLPQSTLDAMITPDGNDYVDIRSVKTNE